MRGERDRVLDAMTSNAMRTMEHITCLVVAILISEMLRSGCPDVSDARLSIQREIKKMSRASRSYREIKKNRTASPHASHLAAAAAPSPPPDLPVTATSARTEPDL